MEERRPEIGSPAYYMDPQVLKKRGEEGFTHVNYGGGEWIGYHRIVRLFVFYHPDGRIATYEHPKYLEYSGAHTGHGNPFEEVYTKKAFEDYKKKWKIKLRKKKFKIEEIIETEKRFGRL